VTRTRRPDSDAIHSSKTFQLPPRDWNPLDAADDVLLGYGYPRRPNPHTHPRIAQLWTEVMARRPDIIRPKSGDPIRPGQKPIRRRQGRDFGVAQYSWGGVQVDTSASRPAYYISAKWQVPAIWPAAGDPAEEMFAGFWVGLSSGVDDSLLQAGIYVEVQADPLSGPPKWSAFTEWYPADSEPIDFEMSTGDLISVVVCADSPTTAKAWFYNYGTNKGAPACPIYAPTNVRLIGSSAVWAAEAGSNELPAFCPVSFTECIAATGTQEFNVAEGSTFEIENDTYQQKLTKTSIVSPTTVVIDWVDFS